MARVGSELHFHDNTCLACLVHGNTESFEFMSQGVYGLLTRT